MTKPRLNTRDPEADGACRVAFRALILVRSFTFYPLAPITADLQHDGFAELASCASNGFQPQQLIIGIGQCGVQEMQVDFVIVNQPSGAIVQCQSQLRVVDAFRNGRRFS